MEEYRAHSAAPATPSIDLTRLGIVLKLHSEFVRICFAITIVGSMINAMDRRTADVAPDSLADHLPAQALLGPQMTREMLDGGLGCELARAALSVGSQLQLCCDLTTSFVRSGRQSQASLEPLIDAWRRLANACYVLEYMIDCAMTGTGAPELKPNRLVFGPLLKQVASGEHPCVDQQGVVSLPGWAERRSASRTKQSGIPATVITEFGNQYVEIINLSKTGAGLLGLSGLQVGEFVSLRVGSLRPFKCSVRWCDDQRGGVAFEQPLHQLDVDEIQSSSKQDLPTNIRQAEEGRFFQNRKSWETPLSDLVDVPGVFGASRV